MIISMSELICVTNRKLCKDDFLERLKMIADAHPAGIVLREKDLTSQEYSALARQAKAICDKSKTQLILHNFADAASELGADGIHLPLTKLRKLSDNQRRDFRIIGTSCHSIEDALEAMKLGCTYIFAGHIFETDCKPGLKGRGLDFLKEVCEISEIPVYGIGGISPGNFGSVISAGAAGACVMSGFMRCADAADYINLFTE